MHDQLKAVDHRPEFSHTLGSRSGRRRPTVTDDNDGLCFSSGQPRTGLDRQAAKTVVRSPLELRQPAKNRPAKPRNQHHPIFCFQFLGSLACVKRLPQQNQRSSTSADRRHRDQG